MLTSCGRTRVDQQVVTYIFGGTNVIGSRDFTQIGNIEIRQGDWTSLAEALSKVGVNASAITELKAALDHDAEDGGQPDRSLGQRTATWLRELGKKSGHLALGVGLEVVKKEATNWVLGYLGLKA